MGVGFDDELFEFFQLLGREALFLVVFFHEGARVEIKTGVELPLARELTETNKALRIDRFGSKLLFVSASH